MLEIGCHSKRITSTDVLNDVFYTLLYLGRTRCKYRSVTTRKGFVWQLNTT